MSRDEVIIHMFTVEMLTINEIADETGFNKSLIARVLRDNGIYRDFKAAKEKRKTEEIKSNFKSNDEFEQISSTHYISKKNGRLYRIMTKEELIEELRKVVTIVPDDEE